ncbi:DUF6801 domain-containing protein [Mumia sp. DW29H23]|uniref:DUF6801 domain-containing protein n=1 Tax=Mumia sp. DW29H23 TaxID=3421241 RepID=UPI003D6851A9
MSARRRGVTTAAALAAVALVAASLSALVGVSSAAAAHLDERFDYTCAVSASGRAVGHHAVGVRAQVSVPDEVNSGQAIPSRKTRITFTLPETLRTVSYARAGVRQVSGRSEDAGITITTQGVADAATYPIDNLAADWTSVPSAIGEPWTIAIEGDVPAVTVPDRDDNPTLALPAVAVVHVPAAFSVVASAKNAAGELIGDVDAVDLACALVSDDDVLGEIPIVEGEPPNNAPTAVDLDTSAAVGKAVTVGLGGADIDGDPLTYEAARPSHGTVTVSGGRATYVPAAGFVGADTFSYRARDPDGATATAWVTVTVRRLDAVIDVGGSAGVYGVRGVLLSVHVPGARGQVRVRAGDTTVATTSLVAGAATIALGSTALPPGTSTVTLLYLGDDVHRDGNRLVGVFVAKAPTRTEARVRTTKVVARRTRAKVAVAVSAAGARPSGTVTVRLRGRTVGTAAVRDGLAVVTLQRLTKVGRARLTVVYGGDAVAAAGSTQVTVRVRRP